MPKKISEKQKEEIKLEFINGKTLEELSIQFKFTKLTISRNLKKILGEDQYNKFFNKNPERKATHDCISTKEMDEKISRDKKPDKSISNNGLEEIDSFPINSFIEITPLNCEIDNVPQADLSSIPISEIDFPKTLYMIVDNKIELETKLLKEYSEWRFLPENDLNRKTIQVFCDIKKAKSFCKKEQKVIKVPNTDIFSIAAPILLSRGISRIIKENELISL